jgi:hypothetical protein
MSRDDDHAAEYAEGFDDFHDLRDTDGDSEGDLGDGFDHDGTILRGWLDEMVEDMGTGPVPVTQAVRRGRTLRTVRRVKIAGAVVLVGLLGVAGSVLTVARPRITPAPPVKHAVVVNPVHRDVHNDAVFSGTVDGHPWSRTADATICTTLWGLDCSKEPHIARPDTPIEIGGSGDTKVSVLYDIEFRADIARVELSLTDGEQLSLTPASVYGGGLAMVVLPAGVGVATVSTYSAAGSLVAYAVAFHGPPGLASVETWYQPGQVPTEPTLVRTVSGRTPKGVAASFDIDEGPFGTCYVVEAAGRSTCLPLGFIESAMLTSPINDSDIWNSAGGTVGGDVDHVDFRLSDGRTITVKPVHVGSANVAIVFLDSDVRPKSVTEYDAAGHVLKQTAS